MKEIVIVTALFIFLIEAFLNFNFENNCKLPEIPDNSEKLVTKVIDGDTFLIEGGYKVRILGIDADEKGQKCYYKAKEKLEELILGKVVRLEKDSQNFDKYCRYLRHVFINNTNVALELLKSGLVVARIENLNKYVYEIQLAEKYARENKIGCKWKNN